MPTTDNGWDARPDLPLRPLVIAGEAFSPGIVDNDDVHTVLGYVLQQMHERVEPVVRDDWHQADDWGFSYRENRNANSLSRHSGGIAVDYNATRHPNGVPTWKTFTVEQVREVHKILAEVDFCVRWGGDYTGTPDAMHFEINTDPATLHAVAERLRGDDMANYADDFETIKRDLTELKALAVEERKRDRASWRREAALAGEVKRLGGDVDKVLAEVQDEP